LLDVLAGLAAGARLEGLAEGLAAGARLEGGGALALWPELPAERALPARTALQSERRVVLLAQAGGQVVAAPLTPYPPGIPLVLPGEVLSPALVATVQAFLSAGVAVRGLVPIPGGGRGVRCVAPEAASTEPAARSA
jgi:hypothetical protein